MHKLLVLLCLCVLAGCATPATSQLEPPAAWLLVPPKPLSAPKKGEDLVHLHAELRRDAATDKSKLRRLQKWAKTVLKK
jgi:hypothetical protein